MKDTSEKIEQENGQELRTTSNLGVRPDIQLSDGPRRLAVWLNENEYGINPKAALDNAYRNSDGEWVATSLISASDLLPFARLFERANDAIVERRQERSQKQNPDAANNRQAVAHSQSWHDEDKSRADINRERLKEERTPARGPRREKPRDIAAR